MPPVPNAIPSQGVTLWIGQGTSPETWTKVGRVTNFDGPGGNAAVIDTTDLDSTEREKMMGLPDEGQFQFDLNLDPANAGQEECRAARSARELRAMRLVLTDAGLTTLDWFGYVLNFSIGAGTDDKIGASCTVEITGAVSWATPGIATP